MRIQRKEGLSWPQGEAWSRPWQVIWTSRSREEGNCQALAGPLTGQRNVTHCSTHTLQGSRMCVRSSLIKTLVTDIMGSKSGHW